MLSKEINEVLETSLKRRDAMLHTFSNGWLENLLSNHISKLGSIADYIKICTVHQNKRWIKNDPQRQKMKVNNLPTVDIIPECNISKIIGEVLFLQEDIDLIKLMAIIILNGGKFTIFEYDENKFIITIYHEGYDTILIDSNTLDIYSSNQIVVNDSIYMIMLYNYNVKSIKDVLNYIEYGYTLNGKIKIDDSLLSSNMSQFEKFVVTIFSLHKLINNVHIMGEDVKTTKDQLEAKVNDPSKQITEQTFDLF